MANEIIPPINAKGKFVLSPPFDGLISDKEEFTVVAIRSLTEIEPDNPLDNIYKPVGLTEDDMKEDRFNNIQIIVLSSTSGRFVYVPSNKIASMPIITGASYQERMLSINLGLLPERLDLSLEIDDIREFILSKIGVNASITEVDTSAVILVEDVEDETLTRLRENRKTNEGSLYNQLLRCKEESNKKTEKIKKLECYIKKINGSECE